MRVLLPFQDDAGEHGLVGEDEAERAVGFDDVDPARGDDAKTLIADGHRAAQNGRSENRGQHSRIDGKKPRARQKTHSFSLCNQA